MAKKKTVTKKKTAGRAEATEAMKLAVRVGKLFAGETEDGSPEQVGELVRERIGITLAALARIQSGAEDPSAEHLELLRNFAEDNAGVKPGEPVKPRKTMTSSETAQVEAAKALHDLTRHPQWVRIVESLNRKDLALQKTLRKEKKGSAIHSTQGFLDGFDWLRETVLAPALKLIGDDEEAPMFSSGLMVKVDPEALRVTVSAR